MDEMYGFHTTTNEDYVDKILMSPENLMMPAEYQNFYSSSSAGAGGVGDHFRIPVFGSDELISAASAISEAASITPAGIRRSDGDRDGLSSVIKAKIASHPLYPRLLDAYIACQKVGAPPEIASLLDEIQRENFVCKRDSYFTCLGDDPELDEFMDTFCDILVKYKSDLSRPFDEATSFLSKIEMQLSNLCKGVPCASPQQKFKHLGDDGDGSSDEELGGREIEGQEAETRSEDQELKDKLLQKYGNHISSLKFEFSKKKKKGKLPKEARQTLLQWWNMHYKWPYPTEADKNALAESTGLDQKQINNWFINQRKRHWKPSEDMQLAVLDGDSGHFFTND